MKNKPDLLADAVEKNTDARTNLSQLIDQIIEAFDKVAENDMRDQP